jgi:RHS repeat-associated protein
VGNFQRKKWADFRRKKHARDYYPYGETLRAYTTGGVGDRYMFTEKERDSETNLDYFGARYYSSSILRWLVPDPLTEKYPGWSPYNYTLGNPLRYIDPDGKDVWEIDSTGTVVNRITDETQDAFYIVDADGNRIEGQSITFEYGTITSTKGDTEIFNPFRRRGDKMTLFYVKGEDNAKNLFEFFADPKSTNVEWSWANIYRGPGNSVVGTSHLQEGTRVGRYLRVNQYFVREYTHNHPGGRPEPSDPGDITVARDWQMYNSNIILQIYIHRGNYIQYNQHGLIK